MIRKLLFPNRVWRIDNYVCSYKPYDQLPDDSKAKVRSLLGVRRFTTSVSPFEYEREGIWVRSLTFCVPGDFRSFPPFIIDDPKYPGLAKTLHEAYA